jgi:glycosyltransferase involved in cell wall biosynthesis
MSLENNRVALYVRLLYGGGAERVMVNLMHGLVAQGVAVDLVMHVVEGPYLAQIPNQVRVINLKAPRMLEGLPKLASYIRKERPRALLSALHYTNEIALWARALAFSKTRIIVSEHNTLSIHSKYRKTDRWAPTLARFFYPWADKVVAVSEGVAKDLNQSLGLPKSLIEVIYNPIVTPLMLEKSQQPLEHSWFKAGEPPVVLGVGRLEPQKNFPLLIHAFAKVRRQRPARLIILGSGGERQALEALVKELDLQTDVSIVSFLENPYPYIAKSDVYVSSSNWEGFGNVIVEAMALGTPIVSTDCPYGPAEILEGGKYGALVPKGDADVMATRILDALSGKIYATDPRWMEQFSVQTATQRYLDILDLSVR